ncbi:MAG: anthranilate synthase component I family protein [Bacteroidota bacterium]|nr:anthranilate synthase component I family protein [Bacteroidota bacterium]MDP4211172.1 anthranilate synthase component I family protein [Bacteroidota bacterium]MDP4249429.1 anthranilate synthase component I family protein [Bacteroidota bacterium]
MASRAFVSFPVHDLYKVKQQVLNWSARFNTCCFLDNQQYKSSTHSFECIAAVGERSRVEARAGDAFNQLKHFSSQQNDWLFGHLSFDLKSETESVPAHLPDAIGFPDLFFFIPETIILLNHDRLSIGSFQDQHDRILSEIQAASAHVEVKEQLPETVIRQRLQKAEYIHIVERLKEHILRGDCYEINFCQEFYAEQAIIDPMPLFQALNRISPSPFSAYYTLAGKFLLCASPERYLKRRGDLIVSQPIKGTAPRDLQNKQQDEELRQSLLNSEKDRAENVMVVDLVRNDLSRICKPDTVKVEELFGIYSFPQVHQMISTIQGRLKPGLHWTEMISSTFPMGSMTGAPKKRVLELIEQYEKTKRGLFSGAVGYVKPNQDFDFNVVIRSLLYNQHNHYLAYFAGSGITSGSDPEKEYEECLMKISAMEEILKTPA